MTDIQTAILTAITGKAPTGLDVRTKDRRANTSDIYVQRGFTTVLHLSCDFQDTYATVQVSGVDPVNDLPEDVGLRKQAARPSEGGPWLGWHFRYTEGAAIERMLAAIEHLIRTRNAAMTPGASFAAPVGSTVHVLEHVTDNGVTITVHASEAGVLKEKAALARLHWDSIEGEDGVPGVAPDDDAEAARIYFDVQGKIAESAFSSVVTIAD